MEAHKIKCDLRMDIRVLHAACERTPQLWCCGLIQNENKVPTLRNRCARLFGCFISLPLFISLSACLCISLMMLFLYRSDQSMLLP